MCELRLLFGGVPETLQLAVDEYQYKIARKHNIILFYGYLLYCFVYIAILKSRTTAATSDCRAHTVVKTI